MNKELEKYVKQYLSIIPKMFGWKIQAIKEILASIDSANKDNLQSIIEIQNILSNCSDRYCLILSIIKYVIDFESEPDAYVVSVDKTTFISDFDESCRFYKFDRLNNAFVFSTVEEATRVQKHLINSDVLPISILSHKDVEKRIIVLWSNQ